VAALLSVFGNTPEALARENHCALARLCGYAGPVLAGADQPLGPPPALPVAASRFLIAGPGPWRVVALGPLTNLAAALRADPEVAGRVAQVIAVGSNRRSRGRWPPWWPFEFNLALDRTATRVVFEAGIALVLVPLDVARRLTVTPAELAAIPGALGEHLRRHSRRWLRRAVLVRGRRAFPVWDLVAALWVVEPGLFTVEQGVARLHPNGWLEHGAGTRPVTVVRGFDPRRAWQRFLELAAGGAPAPAP
jgi:inosine-uridine nucleoside N-ribohydrolase